MNAGIAKVARTSKGLFPRFETTNKCLMETLSVLLTKVAWSGKALLQEKTLEREKAFHLETLPNNLWFNI